MNYNKYVSSKKWHDKIKYFKQLKNNRCEKCNCENDILELHHKTYIRFENELDEDLVLLCRKCHYKIHLVMKIKQLTVEKATEMFMNNEFIMRGYGKKK